MTDYAERFGYDRAEARANARRYQDWVARWEAAGKKLYPRFVRFRWPWQA